jgi:glycosyltransferase involved in cell wall biosynthesis
MLKLSVTFEAGPMADVKKTGVGYYVDSLVTSIASHHPKDIVFTGYYFDFLNHNNKEPQAPANVTWKKIKYIPGKVISACRRLSFQPPLELFIRSRSDVTFFTNFVSLPTMKKTKVALAIYDLSFLDVPEYTQNVNLAFLRRFSPQSIEKADLIITISEFTRDRIHHYFPDLKANIVVTPVPAPVIKVEHKPLGKTLTDQDITAHRYILYVGTIEPRKNLRNLVKAYTLLPKELQKDYALVLVGGKGWNDEDILADIEAAKGQGLKIIQTGYVSHEEKNALYSNATCFVMPSHYEGFGMPLLEAMQYDQPVLCSDIPVFHEVAKDAALYFDKDDAQSIANTLAKPLKDAALRKKLIAAGNKRLTAFSWESNAKLVFDAFSDLRQ